MGAMTNRRMGRSIIDRLPRTTITLLRRLGRLADAQGVALYLVGGVVRDLLLGRKPGDLDLAVEGDGPAFARLVAKRYGASLVPYERFGTARLIFVDGRKVDCATTRRESYAQPAALPEVQPATLSEDLYRRDFTVNAMAIGLNPDRWGQFYDPYGGRRDVRSKTLRVLHEGSFVDDPTRIFRAIRFAQRFGFCLEPATLKLLRAASRTDLIARLSGPRLRNEILLLVGERNPAEQIHRLAQLRLLRFLHPRLRLGARAARVITVLPKALRWWSEQSRQPIDCPLVYLMALLSESDAAVIHGVSERLQFSSAQSRVVDWAGAKTSHAAKMLVGRKFLRMSQIYHLLEGMPAEAMALLAAKGMAGKSGQGVRRLARRLAQCLSQTRRVAVATTGHDLKRLGLAPGPRYADILARLFDARLDGEIRTDAEERTLAGRLVDTSR